METTMRSSGTAITVFDPSANTRMQSAAKMNHARSLVLAIIHAG